MASTASLTRMRDQLARAQARTRNARQKAGETVAAIVRTGEIGASAFAFSALKTKFGAEKMKIGGLPIELGVTLGTHALALMGIGNNMESHLIAIGDGAFACWAVDKGKESGARWGISGYGGELPRSAGMPIAPSGQRLGDDELLAALEAEGY